MVWWLLSLPLQVAQVPLYASPSFLAPVETVLVRGMEVEILEEQPGWKRVSVPEVGKTGWIPATALERPRLLLPGKTGGKDEERAVALASKGLAAMAQQEEAKFPGILGALNHLESLVRIALRNLSQFAREGDLR